MWQGQCPPDLLIVEQDVRGNKKEYVPYVLETPSVELAQAICMCSHR